MATSPIFTDRVDAGRRLGVALRERCTFRDGALVGGIPRGGIVVAAGVAHALGLPLRAVIARKVGAPGHAELAIGAVGPDGIAVGQWYRDFSQTTDEEVARLLAAG